jgi:hypothetical protein
MERGSPTVWKEKNDALRFGMTHGKMGDGLPRGSAATHGSRGSMESDRDRCRCGERSIFDLWAGKRWAPLRGVVVTQTDDGQAWATLDGGRGPDLNSVDERFHRARPAVRLRLTPAAPHAFAHVSIVVLRRDWAKCSIAPDPPFTLNRRGARYDGIPRAIAPRAEHRFRLIETAFAPNGNAAAEN